MSFNPTTAYGDTLFSPTSATIALVVKGCTRSVLSTLTPTQLTTLRTNLEIMRGVLEQEDTSISTKQSTNSAAVSLLEKQQQSITGIQTSLGNVLSAVPTENILGCPEYIQLLSDLSESVIASIAEGVELQYRREQLDVRSSDLALSKRELQVKIQRLDQTTLAVDQLLGV